MHLHRSCCHSKGDCFTAEGLIVRSMCVPFKGCALVGMLLLLLQLVGATLPHMDELQGQDIGASSTFLANEDQQMQEWSQDHIVFHRRQRIRSEHPRGVVAMEHIPRGARVISISLDDILHLKQAEQSAIGSALRELNNISWRMGVYVAWFCHLHPEGRSHGICISWPQSVDHSVVRWTPDEVEALLPSRHVYDAVIRIRESADHAWSVVSALMQRHTDLFPQALTRDQWEWGWLNVNMRNFLIEDKQDPSIVYRSALVPYLDLYNHRRLLTLQHGFDYWKLSPDGKQVTFFADTAFDAGEEVFISYGETSMEKMLLDYGYVLPPPSDNVAPRDVLLWTMGPPLDDPLLSLKHELLRNWPGGDAFVYASYVPNRPTMAMARAMCVQDGTFLRSNDGLTLLQSGAELDEANTECALALIHRLLRLHADKYPDGDLDREALEHAERDGLSWNMRTAIEFRFTESTIVRTLLAAFDRGEQRVEEAPSLEWE